MKTIYQFPDIPEMRHLTVIVENRGRKLRTKIEGRCSPKLWLWTKWYFAAFSQMHPLAEEPDGNLYSLYLPPIPSQAHARTFTSTLSSHIFKRPLPIAATIGVSEDCQYHCVHCSAAGRSRSRPVLSIEQLKKVIRECLDLGVANITFTGGEPLLQKELEECVALVPGRLATSQVFTNALELTESRARSLKEAGLHAVQISLDSPVAHEHNQLRGHPNAFRAVQEGIRNALQAGLYVGISTYATKKTAHDHRLLQIARLCSEWGVHEITVFDAINTGRMKEQNGQLLDMAARKVLLTDSKAINRKFRGKMRVATQSWTNSGKGFARMIGCLAGHMQIHITSQGDITPCDFTPLSFGNVTTQSVRELWQKLVTHPAYSKHTTYCRMQDPEFRKAYIEHIPEGSDLPFYIHEP